ncbi:hypothetical protein GJAV_G00072080 [Gymnothorax javanicus]|nr:hypothetical protein GJAV_G00072080 [Gymnothorax javanicus]
MNTEPVMDSIDYKEVVVGSCLIKREDTEACIEEKNGYGMSREQDFILSNIKEEEEGGERKSEEVKREWEQEKVGDEIFSKSKGTERWLIEERIRDGEKQEEEGSSPLGASCVLKEPGVPILRSPVISSFKGESEVFACSQCPLIHMEEEKFHQHIEKVHPEEHSRILGYVGTGAENPLPANRKNRLPTPSTMFPIRTQPHTGVSCGILPGASHSLHQLIVFP